MANIGVAETYHAILVKKAYVNEVDAYIKNNQPIESILNTEYCKSFRYRFLSKDEVTRQAMSGWLKNMTNVVVHTSETTLEPETRDKVYFLDGELKGEYLQVLEWKSLVENSVFAFSKKPPKVIQLA